MHANYHYWGKTKLLTHGQNGSWCHEYFIFLSGAS